MYIQLEVMIPLPLHVLSVLLYTPVKFLARGTHFKKFTSSNVFLYIHVFFFQLEMIHLKNVNTIRPCNGIQV